MSSPTDKSQKPMTYADAGVDIDAGNALVAAIKPLAKATSRSGADVDLGGFGGLFDLKRAGFRDPALVLRWEDIAGPEVARLARPIKLSEGASGGVLTLKAEPGAALFLQHESRALCGRINDYLGRNAVTRLRFVQGPLAERPPKPIRRTMGGLLPPDDPAITFKGPEKVRESLLRFAKLRQRAD